MAEKVLVCGATGLIGREVARHLLRLGYTVRGLTTNVARAREKLAGVAVELVPGDVREPLTLPVAMDGCAYVVDAVQFPHFPVERPDKRETFEAIDWRGTENLLAAAKDKGVKRFAYVSGANVGPGATKRWALAKWHGEQAVRASGIPFSIFRPSWVYGPRDRTLNRFVALARFSPALLYPGSASKQRVNPIFVDDLARCIAQSLSMPEAEGRVFEAGGPETLTVQALLQSALEAAGLRRTVVSVPATVALTLARAANLLPGRLLSADAIEFATQDAVVDTSAFDATFGPERARVGDALKRYLSPRTHRVISEAIPAR